MTVLYRLDVSAAEIARHFAALPGDDPWQRGHVGPGGFAPVIVAARDFIAGPRPSPAPPRRLVPRRWGVPPPRGADDPARGVLTVRNPASPFWSGNLRNSEFRCLVPATAWMEWGRANPRDGKRPQHWLHAADQPLCALAGVWRDSEVPSFALLTCPANAMLGALGIARMPVVLPRDPAAWELWLTGDWATAEALIAPYPSGFTTMR